MNSSTVRKLASSENVYSTDNEDDRQKSKRQKIVIDLTSSLCVSCQSFNLDLKFDEAIRAYERIRDGSVPSSDAIVMAADGSYFYNDAICAHIFSKDQMSKSSDCPLCQFFQSLCVQPERYPQHKLLAFRSSDSWLFRADRLRERELYKEYKDTVFMAVVPHIDSIPPCGHEESWLTYEIPAKGAIYRRKIDDAHDNSRKIALLESRELDDKVNLDGVHQWLNLCRRSHGKACMRQVSHEPISHYFRLINCTKVPPVVEERPWGVTYAALSYVWGSTPQDMKDWPETVLDAVEVTKRLGLEYLWVDRLCINQSNTIEKSYLISRMATIYDQADFTIVAAAGSGASHGLPGVGSTPLIPQPKYYLDSGSMLLSILKDPRRNILESNYWTRGWTYQEGVLSNRRIVFTDQQVYWECRCMAAHESASMTLFHMPASDEQTFDVETFDEDNSDMVMTEFMLTGIFKGDAHSGGIRSDQEDLVIEEDQDYRLDYGFPAHREGTVRAQLRGLNEHTREFSKRKLTHNMDTLPAFLGIIGLYEKTPKLHLLHGIPIWMGDVAGRAAGAQITFALSISSWYHRAGTDRRMFLSEPCRRKTHLPSWTWAGWEGIVTWRTPPNLEHCAYMSDLIKAKSLKLLWAANIYLCSADRLHSIQLLNIQSAASLGSEAPPLIDIKNPILLNRFQRVEDTKKQWAWKRRAGRPGREQLTSQSASWDARWFRIGGRLSCVSMSVELTEKEWTDKHYSGELISVLLFAGQYLENEHGSARFLTLRKVTNATGLWERVGLLNLIIPFLAECPDNQGLLKKVPAERRHQTIVIR